MPEGAIFIWNYLVTDDQKQAVISIASYSGGKGKRWTRDPSALTPCFKQAGRMSLA